MTVNKAGRKLKPEIREEDFQNNPLVNSDFKVLVNKRADGSSFILSGEEWVPKEFILERDPITKVFIGSDNRKLIAGLSAGAQRLFLWVMYELDSGRDYLWINKKRYMEENGITSLNTYKKALKELVRLTFLCPSLVRDVFWINPRLYFSGSRINKYPDRVEEYEPKKKQQ